MRVSKSFFYLFLASFVITFCSNKDAYGQKRHYYSAITKSTDISGLYLKYSPLSMLNVEPSIKAGIEYSHSKNLRIEHEIAYITLLNNLYYLFYQNKIDFIEEMLEVNGVEAYTTFKFLRPHYIRKYKKQNYIGIELKAKYLQITDPLVQENNEELGFSYLNKLTTHKFVASGSILFGRNIFSEYDNFFLLDVFIGLGIKYKYISNNAPLYADYPSYLPFYDKFENNFTLSFRIGLKLGFRINKKY